MFWYDQDIFFQNYCLNFYSNLPRKLFWTAMINYHLFLQKLYKALGCLSITQVLCDLSSTYYFVCKILLVFISGIMEEDSQVQNYTFPYMYRFILYSHSHSSSQFCKFHPYAFWKETTRPHHAIWLMQLFLFLLKFQKLHVNMDFAVLMESMSGFIF